MIDAFYLLAAAFLSNEIYHIFNRKRLDLLYEKKQPENIRKIDIFYYLLRVGSAIWPFVGLFSSLWGLFAGLILASFFKFAIYHANEEFYKAYSLLIYPMISIVIYSLIFIFGFIR